MKFDIAAFSKRLSKYYDVIYNQATNADALFNDLHLLLRATWT